MSGHPKQFAIYKDVAGKWRWTLYAMNSKKIADGAEGYERKADCIHGIDLVAGIATGAAIWNRDDQRWERQ